jgi:hypothetical protein
MERLKAPLLDKDAPQDPFVDAALSKSLAQRVQWAAWTLEHACRGIFVKGGYPPKGRDQHFRLGLAKKASSWAVLGLLLLSVFEAPAWCGRDCNDTKEPMFGVPFLPKEVGHAIDLFLLAVIFWQVVETWRMDALYAEIGVGTADLHRNHNSLFAVVITVGFLDAALAFAERTSVRLAPVVRSIMCLRYQSLQRDVVSLITIMIDVSKVALFYGLTVILFGWIAATLLDDAVDVNKYGDVVNFGFQSLWESLYTMFVSTTGDFVPDFMIAVYANNRLYVLLFVPFLFLTIVIFAQVIIAVVYQKYQGRMSEEVAGFGKGREAGIERAFYLLAKRVEGSEQLAILYDEFEMVIREYIQSPQTPSSVDPVIMRVTFDALDDDASGHLDLEEFREICDILEHDIWTTPIRGELERFCPCVAGTAALAGLNDFVEDHLSTVTDGVLVVNACLIILESWYDLHQRPEPPYLETLDTFFTLWYLFDVLANIAVTSFGTYWAGAKITFAGTKVTSVGNQNKFDFFTTFAILGANLYNASPGYSIDRDVLRLLNILRILRLVKLLLRIEEVKTVAMTIWRMLTTSIDVLVLNLFVLFTWASIGVQAFGGTLTESFKASDVDPRAEAAGYDGSFLVLNFNDLPSAMVSMFVVMLCQWWGVLADACLSVFGTTTSGYIGVLLFFVSYYVLAVLVAFNVLVAFAIDAFIALDEGDFEDPDDLDADTAGGVRITRDRLFEEGEVLHYRATAALLRNRMCRQVFKE